MALGSFELEVRPPFRLDLTVWALRRRPHNTIDRFEGDRWHRVLVLGGAPVDVAVGQVAGGSRPRVAVELEPLPGVPGDAVVGDARRLVCRCLGLEVDLGSFYRLAAADQRLAGLAIRFAGLRPPRFPSMFEALVNAIACQQLSLTVGIHLLDRLAAAYGPPSPAGEAHGFPTPERLAQVHPEDLRPLGFSGAKARAISGLARQIATGGLDLERLAAAGDDEARRALLDLPGIGRWSAEYALLRGLGRLHVLPGDDVGARNNLRRRFGLDPAAGYDEVAALSRSWWPYGGLVYFHLLLDALADAGQVAPTPAGPPG